MSTLEDKILGEKLQYYCSSSSEDEENDSVDFDKESDDKYQGTIKESLEPSFSEWDGTSSNTGPKGVIKDWQRYKQLEAEKREKQEKERLQLIKKLSLSCRSSLDEEKEKISQTDPDLADLLTDEFLLKYQIRRMKEMIAQGEKIRFGKVFNLETTDHFLDAIDNENESVTVIVHVYENNVPGCENMNRCLIPIAKEYIFVKFCKILGSVAGVSRHFQRQGVPALLVYKAGEIIGNFIHVTDYLGVDLHTVDVELFLVQHGLLTDKSCVPAIILENEDTLSDSE